MAIWLQILINIVFSIIGSMGFALTINVPRRALFLTGISGACGWMTYWVLIRLHSGRMIANLVGAFVIGMLGLFFARIKKCPVSVFNIPALVPLVPGAPAYMAVRALVQGKYDMAEDLMLRVGIITVAIALGFLLSTLQSEFIYRLKMHYKNKQ
ncbi:threonine/serine exporter family protein [Lactobacillus mulieris]|uniref:threonine/serine exporter family protein n=1 Tax=Lactobacillus mulieris TaxID=2508708 RepID=UPI0014330182|nr:threonine/serine exporter family protein [Lactobacillus mulieris]MCF1783337.1 threonine/serine exporter family protein [Lactobacillus mulieris]MCW8104461.1 threonine/serine exporter family protein [Lactobacillus mulieris]MDK6802982.1 threonine/serine exporter family protein [Lactobacillus mulieris]MDK8382098.1 threonine/serine exporter family protein [Lactobacillus mulieris]MDT9620314.1 threonine/serine exporter family protein [Lactobacillus mulieris]